MGYVTKQNIIDILSRVGGGGTGITVDTLWEGKVDTNTTITLDKSYTDYQTTA